jgi:hypothetical protein
VSIDTVESLSLTLAVARVLGTTADGGAVFAGSSEDGVVLRVVASPRVLPRAPQPGECWKVEGEFRVHPRFGGQLVARSCSYQLPRGRFAMASSGLLDEYVEARSRVVPSDKLPAPLLTPSSSEDLKVTLQESNEFILLDHVTQMVDFMPGFKNREAMHEKHLMLAKVLDANELPQFMLKLDAKQAEDAGNLMADLLLQYVKGQDLTKVLSGELKLADIPALHDEVQQLAGVTAKTIVGSLPSRQSGLSRHRRSEGRGTLDDVWRPASTYAHSWGRSHLGDSFGPFNGPTHR